MITLMWQQLTRYHTHTRNTLTQDEELIADDLRRSVTADHTAFQVFSFSLSFHAFIQLIIILIQVAWAFLQRSERHDF